MSKIVFSLKMKSSSELNKKIRKTWEFSPVSRSFKSVKDYNRKSENAKLKKEVLG